MKTVVIIGCGYAGLAAAQRLSRYRDTVQVMVIDRGVSSYALPMLPDIIGRGFAPSALSFPIIRLHKRFGFRFINTEVKSVDRSSKKVAAASGIFPYDYLLIASGSETNFYGNEEVRAHSYKVDTAEDAFRIRRRLEEDRSITRVFISGGGYTGIEVATNVREFCRKSGRSVDIGIIERAPDILGPLPQWMKDYVKANLKRLGIEAMAATTIEKVSDKTVRLSNGKEYVGTLLIWAAGVKTSSFIDTLAAEKNPQGRVKVDRFLRLDEACFVAGDAAYVAHAGGFLRMAVQFAITQGELAADNILRSIRNAPLQAYKPVDFGYIIPMANDRGCGSIMGVSIKGPLTLFLHYFMCLYRSIGWSNRSRILNSLLQGERRGLMGDLASLILRFGLGSMFAAHGAQKAFGMFNGPGIGGFTKMLQGLGFTAPSMWAYIAAYVELIGGLCLIAGIMTRVSSLLLLILIVTAGLSVHVKHGFFLAQGGFEYPYVIACGLLAILLSGGGKYSIYNKL